MVNINRKPLAQLENQALDVCKHSTVYEKAPFYLPELALGKIVL